MRKYKIIHLISSLKVGGAETVLCDLLRTMDKDLFENHVIYFHTGPNVEKLKSLKIPTYQIKGLICKYDPIFIFRLFFLIRKFNPDAMHSSLWSANVLGGIVGLFFRIPQVAVLHLSTNFEKTGKNSWFRNMLDKFVLKLPKKIVLVSDSMVNELKTSHQGWFPFNKVEVIKNGIDVKYFKDNTDFFKRHGFGINENDFVVGTVGRFIERKNQLMLINAFHKLSLDYKNVKLMLVGYGPLQNVLEKTVQELNLKDKVIFFNTSQAYRIYKLFDCFVLPSNNESFGIVTLEAMCFEIPCIVTSENLEHEIIDNGYDGFVIPINDTLVLYERLKFLYKNGEARRKIGTEGFKKASEMFDLNIMTNRYSRLFIDIAEEKKKFSLKNKG